MYDNVHLFRALVVVVMGEFFEPGILDVVYDVHIS